MKIIFKKNQPLNFSYTLLAVRASPLLEVQNLITRKMKIEELIKSMSCVTSIETNNKTITPKPHLKITVSKSELKDCDLDKLFNALETQTTHEWTLDIFV